MAIATTQDRTNLGSQNFLRDNQRYKKELIAVARHVYAAIETVKRAQPQPVDLTDALTLALCRDGTFGTILGGKPHLNTALHLGYAEALARVLRDDEWPEIIK